MRTQAGSVFSARAARWGSIQSLAATPSTIHGRAAAYRRLSTIPSNSKTSTTASNPVISQSFTSSSIPFLRSSFLPQNILFRPASASSRYFHSRSALFQQAPKETEDVKKTKDAGDKAKEGATEGATGEKKEGETENKKEGEEESGEEKEGDKDKKKEDAPPPPPHGDKTPWQVFTETLKSEFQASKEWNEGTKAISSGVTEFTQNPTVQKARTTYSKVTDTATTKTAEALKSTAQVVGKGAAWTWETTPVKGVRKVANVTGTGLEYVTRPVRQSKAFQAVKETVDDGSSSRYGGWVEKEERRRRRELRELNELQRAGGKKTGPLEEDPKYVAPDCPLVIQY